MARILILDTATKQCSVALSEHGHAVAWKEERTEGYVHAERLMPLIDALLDEQAGTNLPWRRSPFRRTRSFTGLRIGVSTAKGLCHGLGLPLIALDTWASWPPKGRAWTRPLNVVSPWWTPDAWKSTLEISTTTAAASRPPARGGRRRRTRVGGSCPIHRRRRGEVRGRWRPRADVCRGVALGARRAQLAEAASCRATSPIWAATNPTTSRRSRPGPRRTPRAEVHLGRGLAGPGPHLGVVHLMENNNSSSRTSRSTFKST